MNHYTKLKNELITCPYCNNIENLYYINQHLKTTKCIKLQKLFIKTEGKKEFNKIHLLFTKKQNELKTNIKYNI